MPAGPGSIGSVLALLLLTSLFAGALQDFGTHTDDGCGTEIHCLACRSALGRQAIASSTAVTLAGLHTVGTVVEDQPVQPEPIRLDVHTSRGPPSAS
jgi:hypothetical protein